MKALRIFALLVGVLLLGIALAAVVVLSSSGIQKWALLKVLNDQDGVTARAEHVDLGLSGIELREFQMLSQEGPSVMVGHLKAETRPWKALFSKELHLTHLQGSGIVVDLSRVAEDKRDKDKGDSDFEGIFEPLRDAGYTFHIGEVDVDLRLELPDQQHVTMQVTGGSMGPGLDGSLVIASRFVPSPDVAPGVDAISSTSRMFMMQDGKGPTAVRIETETQLAGAQVPEGSHARTLIDLQLQEDARERYQVGVETVGVHILDLTATFEPKAERIDYRFTLDVPETLMANLGLGALVNPFSVKGEGEGSVDPDEGTASVAGGLVGTFVPVTEEGARLAPIAFNLDWDAAADKNALTISSLALKAGTEGTTAIDLYLPKALRIDLGDPVASLEADADLFNLNLDVSLIGWVPSVIKEGRVTGKLRLITRNGTLILENTDRIEIRQLLLALPGREDLGNLSFSLSPSLRLDRESVQLGVSGLRGEREGAPIISGNILGSAKYDLEAETPVRDVNLSGQLQANLDTLYAILLPASEDPGDQGTLNLTFSAKAAELEGPIQAESEVRLNGVSPRDSEVSIEALQLQAKVTRTQQGRLDADVPVRIRGSAGSSDVHVKATIEPAQSGSDTLRLHATVQGKQLFVDDLIALAAAFQLPAAEEQPAAAPGKKGKDQPDTQPLWAGMEGGAAVRLDKVVIGTNTIQNLQADLDISSRAVELKNFQASMGGDPLQAAFTLAFNPGPSPYQLQSQVHLNDFDVSQVEGMADQLVSGVFDVQANFGGTGPNLDTLAEWLEGRFDFKAQKALFKPLGSSALGSNLVGTLGGVLSGVLQQKGKENYAAAAQEVISLLQGIETDHMEIQAELQEGMDLNLKRIEILTPQLSFIGSGRIDYDPNASLLNQPINLQFQLGAKGRAAQALNSLRMLTGQQNEQGYFVGPKFLNEGTLSTPTSTLASLVREAVTGYNSGTRIELPEEPQTPQQQEEPPPSNGSGEIDPAQLLRGLLEGRRKQ